MADEHSQWERDNRDLLIKLSTQVDGIRTDLKDLRDSTASRLASVEAGKLDRTEANRLQSEAMEIHADHESRLRFIERYLWLAVGVLTAATFILNYFQPFSHITLQ